MSYYIENGANPLNNRCILSKYSSLVNKTSFSLF